MKILVVCDIHGNAKNLTKLVETFKEKIDAIVCPGDFTDLFADTTDFDQLDITETETQKLLSLNKHLFCVPGNNDPYDVLEIFEYYQTNVHKKIKKLNNLLITGFGGAQTPFNTSYEPTEEEIKEGLGKIEPQLKGDFVFVTHNPPKDTKLDKLESGEHVGSKLFRDFILKHKPLLAISAHIFEAKGEDKLGDTTLFYPGALTDGFYGIVDIEGKKVKCEIKKLV